MDKYNLDPDWDEGPPHSDGRTYEEDGLRIIAPYEEEEGWCDNEEMGIECSYPYCQCQDPPYEESETEELLQELPEMFDSARIEDGFYDE